MSKTISARDIVQSIVANIPAKRPIRDVSRIAVDVAYNTEVKTIPGTTGKTAHVMSRTARISHGTHVETHVIPYR